MNIRAVTVDDEPLARRRLKRLLAEHSDVELVGVAASGTEAIKVVLEERPDVVFLDVRMPDKDGLETLRALHEHLPESVRPLAVFTTVYEEHAVYAIDMEVGKLALAESAVVHGNVTYESNEEAEIADTAQIGGALYWNCKVDSDDAEAEETARFSFWGIAWKVWAYLRNLIVGAVFLLLGGPGARAPAASLRNNPAPGLGFGFMVAVVFPIACLVAIALIVTLPLGVIGLLLFGLGAFIARLVTAQFIGDWLLSHLVRGGSSEYLSLAVGLLLLFVVAAIPYVGFLIRMVAITLGIGGIYLALRAAGFPVLAAPRSTPSDTLTRAW